MKRIVTVIILLALIFVTASCKKRIPYVSRNKLTTSLEEDLDIYQVDSYDEHGYLVSEGRRGKACWIRGGRHVGNGSITVYYQIYDNVAEAEERFTGLFESNSRDIDPEEIIGYCTDTGHGYLVVDEGDFFLGLYGVRDSVFLIDAHSEEQVDDTKEFLEELGLPID